MMAAALADGTVIENAALEILEVDGSPVFCGDWSEIVALAPAPRTYHPIVSQAPCMEPITAVIPSHRSGHPVAGCMRTPAR